MPSDLLDEGIQSHICFLLGPAHLREAVSNLFLNDIFEEVALGQLTR